MKNTSLPLSEADLDRLDHFLFERFDEDTDTEGKDEGVLVVSELDGFFTAIVSGPTMILPSQWLPAIWGDFEPVWENETDLEEIFGLMVRFMNEIADTLMEKPQKFEPLFLEREVEGRVVTLVDEWCQGYMRGVSLAAEQWESGGLEMEVLLSPMMTFASEPGWQALEKMNEAEIETIQQAITPNLRKIHAFWLACRQDFAPVNVPARHTGPRVGRNDPCPCGSGRKYKKCCLH